MVTMRIICRRSEPGVLELVLVGAGEDPGALALAWLAAGSEADEAAALLAADSVALEEQFVLGFSG